MTGVRRPTAGTGAAAKARIPVARPVRDPARRACPILTDMAAVEEMAKLQAKRQRAEARIGELEAERDRAGAMLAGAREAVAQYHRRGSGRRGEQAELEQALAEANAMAAEPWAERIEGARRAARDARQEVQRFTAEHLDELIAERSGDGQVAAERINAACRELLAGYQEWSAVAQEISALASTAWAVRPGDVTFTRCEALASEATRLLASGGEQAPGVRRDPRVTESAVA